MKRYGKIWIIKITYNNTGKYNDNKYWYWEYTDLRDCRHKHKELRKVMENNDRYILSEDLVITGNQIKLIERDTRCEEFDGDKPNEKWVDWYVELPD